MHSYPTTLCVVSSSSSRPARYEVYTPQADLYDEGFASDARNEVNGTAILCLTDETTNAMIYTL